jgi:hypothetical protein
MNRYRRASRISATMAPGSGGGRKSDHGKTGKHGRDTGSPRWVGRLGVTSGHVGAGRLPVSVSFRSFRGQSSSTMAWATQSPSKQANTLEQKGAKIAKKSKNGNNFRRFQSVFQRWRQPPLEALSAFFLRDLCDLLFSCFRVFSLVQGIFMLDRNRKTYVLRAGRHSVSVSFRPFRGQSSSTMAWATRRPSNKNNGLEER